MGGCCLNDDKLAFEWLFYIFFVVILRLHPDRKIFIWGTQRPVPRWRQADGETSAMKSWKCSRNSFNRDINGDLMVI